MTVELRQQRWSGVQTQREFGLSESETPQQGKPKVTRLSLCRVPDGLHGRSASPTSGYGQDLQLHPSENS